MSFTVDDFQDLLRLLEERPDWRDALRRQVLPDGVLGMPEQLRELAAAQVRTEAALAALTEAQVRTEQRVEALEIGQTRIEAALAALSEAQVRTEQRVGALEIGQTRIEAALAALSEAQARTEQRVGALEASIAALTEDVRRLEQAIEELVKQVRRIDIDVATLKGDVMELRYARRAPALFATLARRLRVLEVADVADLLDDAVDEGRITQKERDVALWTDLVLTGRSREDRSELYLIAELSWGIGAGDVERVVERAAILRKLGRPVLPLVAGDSINAEAIQLAKEHSVWAVLGGRSLPPDVRTNPTVWAP